MAHIDVYTAGCPLCESAVHQATEAAGDRHEIAVHDLHRDQDAASAARKAGVTTVPAIVVDGGLLGCCRSGGVSRSELDDALA